METDKKKRITRPDAVTLKVESLTKISGWLAQIEEKIPGVRVTRSELVNWMIDKQKDELKPRQVAQIKDQFFDDVAFAQWALKQVKEGKLAGQNIKLKDLVLKKRTQRIQKRERTAREKSKAEISERNIVNAEGKTDV